MICSNGPNFTAFLPNSAVSSVQRCLGFYVVLAAALGATSSLGCDVCSHVFTQCVAVLATRLGSPRVTIILGVEAITKI